MKRLLIASGIGVAVFAAVFAAAATLGLSADQLGAGDRAVSSCTGTESINVTYQTQYDPSLASTDPETIGGGALGRYRITNVVLNGFDPTDETACADQKINLILSDIDGDIMGTATDPALGNATKIFTCCGAGSGDGGLLDIDELNIDPRLVYGVHLVITGESNPPPSTQTGNNP